MQRYFLSISFNKSPAFLPHSKWKISSSLISSRFSGNIVRFGQNELKNPVISSFFVSNYRFASTKKESAPKKSKKMTDASSKSSKINKENDSKIKLTTDSESAIEKTPKTSLKLEKEVMRNIKTMEKESEFDILERMVTEEEETLNKNRDPIVVRWPDHPTPEQLDKMSFDEVVAWRDSNPHKAKQKPGIAAAKKTIYVDQLVVKLEAGKGGNGMVHFEREKFRSEAPASGGTGGSGGNIYIEASENAPLNRCKPNYSAKNGGTGLKNGGSGANGKDIIVKVPVGTSIHEYDLENKTTGKVLADLDHLGAKFLAVKGGKGGRGNRAFSSGSNRSPKEFEYGKPGQAGVIKLNLKTIADVGLVGFPNAGKSTLLSVISNAIPKIADYAFTTMNPYVGMVNMLRNDEDPVSVADLPGLLEGASQNYGLGHQFLKHIERTKVLCFVLDMDPPNDISPIDTLTILMDELRLYDSRLLSKPFIIIANKMDKPNSQKNLDEMIESLSVLISSLPIIPISAKDNKGIDDVKRLLGQMVQHSKSKPITAVDESDDPIEITEIVNMGGKEEGEEGEEGEEIYEEEEYGEYEEYGEEEEGNMDNFDRWLKELKDKE